MDLNSYSGFLKTWNELRSMGFIIETDLQRRSLKAMMRDAHKKNARFVAVIGSDELKSGTFILKQLDTGAEIKADPVSIKDILKKGSL
jgi:histidyl-tRNA synthetase